jgi:hypothetical protein
VTMANLGRWFGIVSDEGFRKTAMISGLPSR